MKKMPRTLYLALFLLILGVVAGALLSGINAITKPVIEKNAMKELEKSLAEVNVKNPKDITSTVKLLSGVSNVYSGECDGKECYVYNASNANKYTTVTVLVVLAKEDGKILNLKVSGTPSITTHGFDAQLSGDLGVIGEATSDKLINVSGATFSRNSIKTCLDTAFKMYKSMENAGGNPDDDEPQEPTEQEKMDALLKNVNVTNGKKMEYTVADGSTIKNIYTGKNETEEVYVFETEKAVDVQYPNGGGETVVVKMLTSVSKTNGTIEKIYFSTFASHGIAPTEFGVVGKDNVNDFANITQATYSSNAVKGMLEEILTEYKKIEAAALNDLLAKVEVTEGSKVVYTPAENSEITAVYQGKCNEKDVYVFDGKSTNDFVTVHMLVVVDKATGEVLTSKVIGMFHTYNAQPTDFGMVGATNIDSFENITGATFSSNSAKAIFSAAFAAYTTLKGAE